MASFNWSKMPEFVQAVKSAVHDGIARTAGYVARVEVKEKFSRAGRFGSSPVGSPPAIHTSTLRDSVTSAMVAPMVAKVGATSKYAEVHEFGKHIAALKVRNLRIPINDAARRLSEKSGTQSLRTMGKFRFFKSKAGNLIAVGADTVKYGYYKTGVMGTRKRINIDGKPMFLLKPTVNIPARPFMRPALARLNGNASALDEFTKGATRSLRKHFKTARFT